MLLIFSYFWIWGLYLLVKIYKLDIGLFEKGFVILFIKEILLFIFFFVVFGNCKIDFKFFDLFFSFGFL